MEIEKFGKYTFYTLFGFGSVCFFGYLFIQDIVFAMAGFYYLFIASFISIISLIYIVIYGFVKKDKWDEVVVAIMYILFNVPTAALYTIIGINIIDL